MNLVRLNNIVLNTDFSNLQEEQELVTEIRSWKNWCALGREGVFD